VVAECLRNLYREVERTPEARTAPHRIAVAERVR
jgi:hypothetical protein